MKTLNDFKDEVARENGYKDWKDLMLNNFDIYVDKKADLAAERYAEYMAIGFGNHLASQMDEDGLIINPLYIKDKKLLVTDKELFDIFRQNKQ